MVGDLIDVRFSSLLRTQVGPPPRSGKCHEQISHALFRLLVGMQSVSHCHKPRFLIAVGRVWDLWPLQ
jgi:hypothetical protein